MSFHCPEFIMKGPEQDGQVASTNAESNKQTKISSFFQAPPSGARLQSQLFSRVGSSSRSGTSKLSTKKPGMSKDQHSLIYRLPPAADKLPSHRPCNFTAVTTKSVQGGGGSSSVDVLCVPETQFLSPEKHGPGAAGGSHGNSPGVVVIPDTPEEQRSGVNRTKKMFSSRSFLSMKTNPVTREPMPKIEKRRKSKLTGKVSVSFNNLEKGLISDGVEMRDGVNTGEQSDSVTPTKSYPLDRVKRLSKSGLSPTPKRSLCLSSDLMTGCIENVPPATKFGASTPSQKEEVVLGTRTTVDKILSHMSSTKLLGKSGLSTKLTRYQLGTGCSDGNANREQAADDDLLGELLSELEVKTNVKTAKSEQRRQVSKLRTSTVQICAMTEEELALFKTLDESFETQAVTTSPDSQSPSLLSKRKVLHDKTSPVRNILKTSVRSSVRPSSKVALVEADSNAMVMRSTEREISTVGVSNAAHCLGSLSEGVNDIGQFSTQTTHRSVSMVRTTNVHHQNAAVEKSKMELMETDGGMQSPRTDLCSDSKHLTPFPDEFDDADDPASHLSHQPPESICPTSRFNRFSVTAVSSDRDAVHLDLEGSGDGPQGEKTRKKCVLHGFWADTQVAKGDIVHVISEFSTDGVCHVTDTSGLIVVCPDLLLSGTSVVSAVHCMRRSVLNEKFKGCDDKNIHMLFGSIIHSMFQQVLKKGLTTVKQMESTATSVMQLNKFLHEMYSHSTTETVVMEEIDKYLPPFKTWVDKYSCLTPQSSNGSSSNLKVLKVHDIEENIWSPRFGVKGKIDLTVEVQMPNSKKKKVLPLELKTGKPTFSIEHKGQVTLYSMMMSDRRCDPEEGVLLYLREPVMTNVAVKGDNKRGLIQLRNELAHYVSQQLSKTVEDGHVTYQYGALPQPINSARSCNKCPQLLNCALYQRDVEHLSHHKGHAMETLVPDTLRHLRVAHAEYYLHWAVCLELERQVDRGQGVKDIWCSSSQQREVRGDCLSGMVIQQTCVGIVTDSQRFSEGESCTITFTRHPDFLKHFPSALHTLGFSVNDMVAVSSDDGRLLVLVTGYIRSITSSSLDVVVDRDVFHKDEFLQNLTYRLDRCDNFNTLGYLFSNLSRLLANQQSRAKLRELIIEKRKPEFQLTMSKGTIEQVKSIFKSLNKPQKMVILKVLMSKDYVLIKGYPGTGKTSTIVALVRILHSLGQSILLTSYTHSAVDNILLKLMKHDVRFLRLGRLGRIHPNVHGQSAEILTAKMTHVQELRDFYNAQGIVATSCLGTNHPIFGQRRFDVCIVDEASQVLQPACLGPLFAADRFVLVGDPKQLPPVVQSREARELGMSESLFVRLDDTGATFDLNLQYRMNKTIMHLSNELIYGGKLQCGSTAVAESRLVMSPRPPTGGDTCRPWLERVLTSDLAMAAMFLDTNKVPAVEDNDGRGMLKNVVECDIILLIVAGLEEGGVLPEDIGVIAPYRHQVKLLRQQLHQRHLEGVEANTVDQFQGRDKSVVIMSFVRSGSCASKTELLQDVRRLNVSVTRAKHKLILVGDIPTLRHYEPLQTLISTMTASHQIISLPPDAHR